MKKIFTFMCAVMALAAVSCTKAELKGNNDGVGILNVEMDLSALTKAALSEDELKNTAKVNIYHADKSGLVRSYTYAEMPSPFYLAAGEYRVDVLAGESVKADPSAASWEQKSYKGSKEFTIVANQVNNVQVEAVVDNAVTKITFDQTVSANFADGYKFTIALDHDPAATQLEYTSANAGSEGYYIVNGLVEPSFVWTFTGTLKKGGSSFTKSGEIKNVLPGRLYTMNLKYTIKDGDIDFNLVVDYTTDIVNDNIVFEPVSTGLAPSARYEIWAKKATLHADVDVAENAGKTVKFAYSSNGSDWEYADGVNDSEGTWKADITGLAPETEYTYKLLIDDVETGEPKTFTTEAAPNLPNASFEYVSLASDPNYTYYKFYDPNCTEEEGRNMFWGSGNGEGDDGVKGSASMEYIITQIDKSDKKHGNQSVKCVNSVAASLLTAGNLFVGQFRQINGMEGGVVDFGRPWTSRPTGLRLWCKYTTGKIDIRASSIPSSEGLTSSDYDRAQIKIAIGTWDYKKYNGKNKINPVGIDTGDPDTFVDFYNDTKGGTVANGDLIIMNDGYVVNRQPKVSATTSGWIQYVIPLNYHSLTTFPTHIIISCSASQFGDYFAGCSSSVLWLDGFELIYD